jgi:sugar phosphate isomerase/epimerase
MQFFRAPVIMFQSRNTRRFARREALHGREQALLFVLGVMRSGISKVAERRLKRTPVRTFKRAALTIHGHAAKSREKALDPAMACRHQPHGIFESGLSLSDLNGHRTIPPSAFSIPRSLRRKLRAKYRHHVPLTRRTILSALPAAAALQAQRNRVPSWKPKLGVLCSYSDANLEFVRAEGFTSMQLRLNPDKLDDAQISAIKDKIQRAGIYVSSLAVDGNHIDPDASKREKQNQFAIKCIELCGKMGIPNIGGQSGTIKGQPLQQQVDEIVRVYTEKYFPVCEKNKVRILWEPYAGGPNIATGPLGWEALFKAFNNSPHVGLQFDPSHLVWQFMDPVQAAREFVEKIYDVHLKDTEILWHVVRRSGIQPVDRVRWWRFRVPGYGSVDWKGFFSVLSEAGYAGAMNIENEDEFYYPPYNDGDFTEQFKRGFRVAHEFLKTLVPPLTA